MFKDFKYYTLVLLATFVVFTSCLNDDDDDGFDPTQYTPEKEAALLKQAVDAAVAGGSSVDTTDVGVIVVDLELGDGDFVSVGDSIGVKYAGYVLGTTTPFDSSDNIDGGIYKFRQVDGKHIKGFYDAMFQLNKGATGSFIMPSSLAYGEVGARNAYGNYVIPPYTPIVFQLELVEIYEKASDI